MKNPQSKENKQKKPLSMPLAEKIRPVTIEEFVGQEHLTADGKIFRTLLNQVDIPSMILWGPPGCGKVRIINHMRTLILIGFEVYNSSWRDERLQNVNDPDRPVYPQWIVKCPESVQCIKRT